MPYNYVVYHFTDGQRHKQDIKPWRKTKAWNEKVVQIICTFWINNIYDKNVLYSNGLSMYQIIATF